MGGYRPHHSLLLPSILRTLFCTNLAMPLSTDHFRDTTLLDLQRFLVLCTTILGALYTTF